MKALQFRKSIPRYVLLRLLGPRFKRLYTSSVSSLSLRDIPEPKLPTGQWVRIAPQLAGICGSDLATICAKGSPYLAPVTSMPFVMGHELVGTISEVGDDVETWAVGDRVVLHPALGCRVRGIDPCCDVCAEGRDALCRNVTKGAVSAGIQTGFCRDTGGAFGENLVAHQSQLYRVPKEMSDRTAVLIEPFSCALHGALRANVSADDTVLLIGCGTIGLLTIAALRALGCQARIAAVALEEHQKRLALELGANELLQATGSTASRYQNWAQALGAEVLDAELGKPTVIGGASVTFDCVGLPGTIEDGLRFTKSAGTFMLIGMPGAASGVDWTPMWFKELNLRAAYAYGPEQQGDTTLDTFAIAIELLRSCGPKIESLVGQPFGLRDYRAAIRAAIDPRQSGSVKTVFDLTLES